MFTDALISDCGLYRYRLRRKWTVHGGSLVFITLNPSTADGTDDDPTIRKCVGFARRLGFGGIVVLNLYAYRATDPRDLWDAADAGIDIEGPENDDVIRAHCAHRNRDSVVAAWGAHGDRSPRRVAVVRTLAPRLSSLGVTKSGAPRHPLMLPYSATEDVAPWPPTRLTQAEAALAQIEPCPEVPVDARNTLIAADGTVTPLPDGLVVLVDGAMWRPTVPCEVTTTRRGETVLAFQHGPMTNLEPVVAVPYEGEG